MRFTLSIAILAFHAAALAYAVAPPTRRDATVTVLTNGGSSGGRVTVADTNDDTNGGQIGAGTGKTSDDFDGNQTSVGAGGGQDDGAIVRPMPTGSDDDVPTIGGGGGIDDINSGNKTKVDGDDQTGGSGDDDDKTGSKKGDCVDRSRSCPRARRFCKTLRLREIMRSACSKTCNFCTNANGGKKPIGVGAGRGGRRGGAKATRNSTRNSKRGGNSKKRVNAANSKRTARA